MCERIAPISQGNMLNAQINRMVNYWFRKYKNE